MTSKPGVLILSENAFITGEVQNCATVEVYGHIDGKVGSERLIVHDGGRLYGTTRASSVEVSGDLQGDISVAQLLTIKATGSVNGNVRYGQLAMEPGGDLSAELRNVPPSLAGDMELSVTSGGSVTITTVDLTAIDPDDLATDLVFHISNEKNGYIALADAPTDKITTFTQAQLQASQIKFIHDGSGSKSASFDIIVKDNDGASSGKVQTVTAKVH